MYLHSFMVGYAIKVSITEKELNVSKRKYKMNEEDGLVS
jgi:hypothetical protein